MSADEITVEPFVGETITSPTNDSSDEMTVEESEMESEIAVPSAAVIAQENATKLQASVALSTAFDPITLAPKLAGNDIEFDLGKLCWS